MYQNQTSRDHTPAELAALKTLLAPDPATKLPTGQYAGMTPAQIAAALAAQRSTPNPAPQGTVPAATIPRLALLTELTGRSSFVAAIPPSAAVPITFPSGTVGQMTAAQFQVSYTQKIAFLLNSSADTVSIDPDMRLDFTLAVGFGIFTPAEIADFAAMPDPNYLVNILAGPLAFRALGADVLPEAADITAALES